MIKVSTHQHSNPKCASNKRAIKYMKQKLIKLKVETDKSTIIAGDSNTPLPTTLRTTRYKISKEIEDLSNPINQQYRINICRTLHPTEAEYTLFSSGHGPGQTIEPAIQQPSANFKNSNHTKCAF